MKSRSPTVLDTPGRRFCLELRPYGNYCPHSCGFCYQQHEPIDSAMNTDTAMYALETVLKYMQSHEMNEIKLAFHGGEPAHDGGSKIFEIVDCFARVANKITKNIRIQYTCHTSGFNRIDINGFFSRQISVCVNRPIPDYLTENKRKVFRHNIESLLDCRMLAKQIIVITKDTIKHIDDCLEAICEYGLPTKLQPQYPPCPTRQPCLQYPDMDELHKFLAGLIKKAIVSDIDLGRVEPINRFFIYKRERKNAAGCRFSEECTFSEGPIKSLAIDPDGAIFACNRFAGLRTFELGNINRSHSSLFDDVENEIRRIVYEHGFRNGRMKLQCSSCPAGTDKACPASGGCPFFSYIWDTGVADPYCHLDGRLYLALCEANVPLIQ